MFQPIILDKIIYAGREGGWALALIVAVAAVVMTTYAWNPVHTVENSVVEPIAASIGISSPAGDYQCPDGWTTTRGLEPESGLNFVTCASADKRYIVTKRDGAEPVAFDGDRGVFVDVSTLR